MTQREWGSFPEPSPCQQLNSRHTNRLLSPTVWFPPRVLWEDRSLEVKGKMYFLL